MRRPSPFLISLLSALLILSPELLFAGRCGTGLRGEKPDRVSGHQPAYRRASARVGAPGVTIVGGRVFETDNFRVIWGDQYNSGDRQWVDPDGDGPRPPQWVEVLGQALESALATQRALGFPDPAALDKYYLDAYVANTGLRVDGAPITLSSSFYAQTEIDFDHDEVAYFTFNNDFSAHAADELGVLRATAAHELFHAVQHATYPWAYDESTASVYPAAYDAVVTGHRWSNEGWWFEATATWMEDLCQPEVNDYVTYVREYFLSEPEAPLTSMDGLREYGAAIFPGYLWLHRGGPRPGDGAQLWQEVFRDAYAAGLEDALDAALLRRGPQGLSDTVASFWSLAAHPEDGWPDGALFREGTFTPRLSPLLAPYPLTVSTTDPGVLAPGRFGATLFRLPASPASLSAELTHLSAPQATFLLSVSEASRIDDPLVLPFSEPQPSFSLSGGGEGFLAVVNTSVQQGLAAFRLVLDAAPSPPAPEPDPTPVPAPSAAPTPSTTEPATQTPAPAAIAQGGGGGGDNPPASETPGGSSAGGRGACFVGSLRLW